MKALKSVGGLPVYWIQWWDHYTVSAWKDVGTIKADNIEPALCHSVGFLVHEDKNHIWLCTSLATEKKNKWGNWEGDATANMVIIKSCIKKSKRVYVKN